MDLAQGSEAASPSSEVAASDLWMGSAMFVGISLAILTSSHHVVVSGSGSGVVEWGLTVA